MQTVVTNAKRKGVHVQLNAILLQGIIHVIMQSKRVEQAELFLCVYKAIDLIYSRSAFIHMSGVHIYAPCNSANVQSIPVKSRRYQGNTGWSGLYSGMALNMYVTKQKMA